MQKRFKFSKIILLCSLSILMFYSCSKRDHLGQSEIIESESFELNQASCFSVDIGFRPVYEGEVHNALCLAIISNWNICSTSDQEMADEITRILKLTSTMNLIAYGIDTTQFRSFIDSLDIANAVTSGSSGDLDTMIDNANLSLPLDSIMGEFFDAMDAWTYEDVDAIIDSTCAFYYTNVHRLDTLDIIYFGSLVDVAQQSATLWMPTSSNGNGGYDIWEDVLRDNCFGHISNRKSKWWAIICKDAAGMVLGAASAYATMGPAAVIPVPWLGGIPPAGGAAIIGGVAMSIGAL